MGMVSAAGPWQRTSAVLFHSEQVHTLWGTIVNVSPVCGDDEKCENEKVSLQSKARSCNVIYRAAVIDDVPQQRKEMLPSTVRASN